jgi:arsenate reductase (glutaredoxin)
MKARIYHNPRCSKSRAALALLTEHGAHLEIVEYLANPPQRPEIERLLRMLGIPALQIVRTEEPEFKAAVAARGRLSDDELIDLLIEHPRLLQRPIVEAGDRAVIGRPPERVLELL